MRRIILSILLLLTLTVFPPAPASASTPASDLEPVSSSAATEPDSGSILCPTGSYISAPDDCLPLGPSASITDLAQTGIPWPITPLPAYSPDPALGDVPFNYFKVQPEGAYVFPTIASAETDATSGQMIGPGHILYVAYQDRVENDTGVYYLLQDGGWIRGEGARAALPYPFLGLQFSSTPHYSFGWVLGTIQSRVAPDFSSAFSDKTYNRFHVVQIYANQDVGNTTWLLIGPNEWVEARYVARVEPRTSSPEGIATPRWIEINLYEQTLAVYDNNQLVFATIVSTGVDPYWTQPGVFSIYEKKPVETMSGSFEADRSDYYYLESVPWTMYFDGKRALHGAYWHSNFGYQMSHGCVNMSLGDSHWLYNWAHNGDVVYVYDPSGRTPTDASLYGAGAP
jgi:hypothetical protein